MLRGVEASGLRVVGDLLPQDSIEVEQVPQLFFLSLSQRP